MIQRKRRGRQVMNSHGVLVVFILEKLSDAESVSSTASPGYVEDKRRREKEEFYAVSRRFNKHYHAGQF